ncbi:HNH endonuclease [Bifidobacterium tibiigranuli]|nr:HNH endonuclease [Bifidobacterium tibiigranuli]
MAKRNRDGYGTRAFRRQAAVLRRRTKREDLPCAWCGGHIDTNLPATDPMSFTADHPDSLANGGRLYGQQLEPMHRRCNSLKSDSQETEIWVAS